MERDPDAESERQRAHIGRLAADLDQREVRYWLMGGWAVDGYLGRVTRAHSDIDLAIYQTDGDAFADVVGAHGYVPTPGAEPAGQFFAGGPCRVELTYLVETPDGHVVTPGFEHWPYPDGALGDDTLDFDGIPVRALSVEALLDTKANWQHHVGEPPRPHDLVDVAALRQLLTGS